MGKCTMWSKKTELWKLWGWTKKLNRRSTLAYVRSAENWHAESGEMGKSTKETHTRTHAWRMRKREKEWGRWRIAFAIFTCTYIFDATAAAILLAQKHKLHQKLTIYMYNLSSNGNYQCGSPCVQFICNFSAHGHALALARRFFFGYTRLLLLLRVLVLLSTVTHSHTHALICPNQALSIFVLWNRTNC